MLETLVLDLAFIGGNGLSLEHGVTVPDSAVAAVKTMAMRASRRRILVADSSKYGVDSFVRFAHLRDFERFITDDGLPVEQAAETARPRRRRRAGIGHCGWTSPAAAVRRRTEEDRAGVRRLAAMTADPERRTYDESGRPLASRSPYSTGAFSAKPAPAHLPAPEGTSASEHNS